MITRYFFFKDCQTLLNRISDGLIGLAIIHSENGNADNQLNLTNLHNGYDNPNFAFSQESRHTYEDDLVKVEYMIEYFKKQKNKQGICKEWFKRNDLFQSKNVQTWEYTLSTLFIVLGIQCDILYPDAWKRVYYLLDCQERLVNEHISDYLILAPQAMQLS